MALRVADNRSGIALSIYREGNRGKKNRNIRPRSPVINVLVNESLVFAVGAGLMDPEQYIQPLSSRVTMFRCLDATQKEKQETIVRAVDDCIVRS